MIKNELGNLRRLATPGFSADQRHLVTPDRREDLLLQQSGKRDNSDFNMTYHNTCIHAMCLCVSRCTHLAFITRLQGAYVFMWNEYMIVTCVCSRSCEETLDTTGLQTKARHGRRGLLLHIFRVRRLSLQELVRMVNRAWRPLGRSRCSRIAHRRWRWGQTRQRRIRQR